MVTELVTHEPSQPLREYVVRCEGFSEHTAGPLRRREIAYPAVPVILSFGTDWWLFDPDSPDAPGERQRSFVAGRSDRAAIVEHGGEARCVQLDLTPPGAHAVFGVAMHELAGHCVALEDLLGERLAGELGCSRRHLGARFREQVGLPPKAAARVLRFHRAVSLLRAGGTARWAEIAQECGYSDQSHFNREFRALSGTSPGKFIASLLPDGAGVAADL